MIIQLRRYLTVGMLTLVFGLSGFTLLAPAAVSARTPKTNPSPPSTFKNDACQGLNQLGGSANQGCGNGDSQFTSLISTGISIFSDVIGIVAIIMVMTAGFKYITSNGDGGNISTAKNTLVYALIGIVVAVMSRFLVHYVINKFRFK